LNSKTENPAKSKKKKTKIIYTLEVFLGSTITYCERSSTMTLKYSPFIYPFVLIAYVLITFFTDYQLAVHQHKPFFAAKSGMYEDGGTTEYKGIGYKVIN